MGRFIRKRTVHDQHDEVVAIGNTVSVLAGVQPLAMSGEELVREHQGRWASWSERADSDTEVTVKAAWNAYVTALAARDAARAVEATAWTELQRRNREGWPT